MKTASVDTAKNDPALHQLLESCNTIQSSVHESGTIAISRGEAGPLRWHESCDKKIAIARDVLLFRITLQMPQTEDERDVVQVVLSRSYSSNLMFDQILSTHIDGKPARPTNQSMHRILDLHFNAIHSGSTVVVEYQMRVDCNAEPSLVAVDDLNVLWSYRSLSKHETLRKAHKASHEISAPHGVVSASNSAHVKSSVLA
ncbi:hypothetical protein [Rhodopirellula bahusiensis]|uniref:Uncharacterized protein n=1 Tax=Rhodopirellula bahusiensis TaxID=2014065 RepID=A0A2G1W8K0_9BACT|nr:hypothetical protein [Rhodopirellula bahusiensis]PHQ35353.1 hypothetical protein CEE69_10045 [Rhodopirellula bahusiensis]